VDLPEVSKWPTGIPKIQAEKMGKGRIPGKIVNKPRGLAPPKANCNHFKHIDPSTPRQSADKRAVQAIRVT
jgi:hypothetical protein